MPTPEEQITRQFTIPASPPSAPTTRGAPRVPVTTTPTPTETGVQQGPLEWWQFTKREAVRREVTQDPLANLNFQFNVPLQPEYGPQYYPFERYFFGDKEPKPTQEEPKSFWERVGRRRVVKARIDEERGGRIGGLIGIPAALGQNQELSAAKIGQAVEEDSPLNAVFQISRGLFNDVKIVTSGIYNSLPLDWATSIIEEGGATALDKYNVVLKNIETIGGRNVFYKNPLTGLTLEASRKANPSLSDIIENAGVVRGIPGTGASIGPSLENIVDEKYIDNPERLAEIEGLIKGPFAQYSYSWQKRLEDGSFFPLVEAYANATNDEDREAILATFEHPLIEMALQTVFDPVNLVSGGLGLAGKSSKAWLQANRLKRLDNLVLEPLARFEDVRDVLPLQDALLQKFRPVETWDDAARYLTGTMRLPRSRVLRLTELGTNAVSSALHDMGNLVSDIKDPTEMVRFVKQWNPKQISFAESFVGRVVKGGIDDYERLSGTKWGQLEEEISLIAKKQGYNEAKQRLATEIGETLGKKAAETFGDPEWIRQIRKWEYFNKRIFSLPYLALNPRYHAGNIVNNMQMAIWDAGWKTGVQVGLDQLDAVFSEGNRAIRAANNFLVERVGFVPERFVSGFGREQTGSELAARVIESEGPLSARSAEAVTEFTSHLADGLKDAPYKPIETIKGTAKYPFEKLAGMRDTLLGVANRTEKATSARFTLEAYKQTWGKLKKLGRGLKPMDDELAARLQVESPEILDEVTAIVNDSDWYRFDELMTKLEDHFLSWIDTPPEDGGTRVMPLNHYLENIFSDDTVLHIQRQEELWGILKGYEGVQTEADVRRVTRSAKDWVDDALREIIRNADVVDARQVGWKVYDVDVWRRLVGTGEDRFGDAPRVNTVLKTKSSSSADVLHSIAREFGTSYEGMTIPLFDEELEAIQRGASSDELAEVYQMISDERFGTGTWAKYDDPVWRQYPKKLTRKEMIVRARDRGLTDSEIRNMRNRELRDFLGIGGLIEHAPPEELRQMALSAVDPLSQFGQSSDSVTNFWEVWNALRPGKTRQVAKNTDSAVRKVLTLRGKGLEEDYAAAFEKITEWAKAEIGAGRNPFLTSEEYDAAQFVLQKRRHLWLYGQDSELIQNAVKGSERTGEIASRPFREYPNVTDQYQWLRAVVRDGLDKAETKILDDMGRASTPISRELWNDVLAWARHDVKRDVSGVKLAAIQEALAKRDFAILNYEDRTYLDLFAAMISPWGYWGTHNMYNAAIRLLDNPRIFANFAHYQGQIEKIRTNPDLPEHLRKQYEGKDLKPEWFAANIPSRYSGYTPFYGLQNFLGAMQGMPQLDFRNLIYPLEAMPIFGKSYLPSDLNDPRWNRGKAFMLTKNIYGSPPLVDAGVVAADKYLLPALRNSNHPWYNPTLAERLERQIPPTDMMRGFEFLPLTRLVKAASVVLPGAIERLTFGKVRVPETGLNLENFLADTGIGDFLGFSATTPQEDYWTDQWLAQLYMEGRVSEDEYWEAFTGRKGTTYEMALRQARLQIAPNVLSSTLSGGTVRYQVLPDAEMIIRSERNPYIVAKERYNKWKEDPTQPGADPHALDYFFERYPEYKLRQNAFDAGDRVSGVISDVELEKRRHLTRRHDEYVKARNEIDDAWEEIRPRLVPGTPEYYRFKKYFSGKRKDLTKEYGDDVGAFYDMRDEQRKNSRIAANWTKYQSARDFVTRFYAEKDPKKRQLMFESLPTSMAASAMQTAGVTPVFTRLDVARILAKNYDPQDQVYTAFIDKGYKALEKYFSEENSFLVQNPAFAEQYEEYLSRDWPEDEVYLEKHPAFAMALGKWNDARKAFWDTKIEFSQEDVDYMLDLHPEWRGTEKEAQFKEELSSFPHHTMDDFVRRTKPNREAVTQQIWRFYTSLTSLDKRNWKDKLMQTGTGNSFKKEFLTQHYQNIPDEVLALWNKMIPAYYSADKQTVDFMKDEYSWMGPPFGSGEGLEDLVPEAIKAQGPAAVEEYKSAIASGASPSDRHEYAPETRVETGTDERIKFYTTPQQAEVAREHAMRLLDLDEGPDTLVETYSTWNDVIRLDRGPDGAKKYLQDQARIKGSVIAAIRDNPHNWQRLVAGMLAMSPTERQEFLFDYPDANIIYSIVQDTKGPSLDVWRQIAGSAGAAFEPASEKDNFEYQQAYSLLQRAYKGESDLFQDPLVQKWFPPDKASARFWDMYWKLPKDVRRKIVNKNELLQAVLSKGPRQFFDETVWGAAIEELNRALYGGPKAETTGVGKPRFPDTFTKGKRTYIGGGSYSKSRRGARNMWIDFQTSAGPLLVGELLEVFRGNRPLSSQASDALEKIRKVLAPDMSLQEFLDLIKQMWIRFGVKGGPKTRSFKVTGLSQGFNRRLSRGGKFFVRR